MQVILKIFILIIFFGNHSALSQVIFKTYKSSGSKTDSSSKKTNSVVFSLLGKKDADPESSTEIVAESDTVNQNLAKVWLDSLMIVERTLAQLSKKQKISYTESFINIPSIWPLKEAQITDRFGSRVHPVTGQISFHSGIDLAAAFGTAVYATANGIIHKVVLDDAGIGLAVFIKHSSGYETVYGHLSGYEVKPGQKVKRGQQIGLVGSTGRSTGPHLHYTVMFNNVAQDPYPFASLSKLQKQEKGSKETLVKNNKSMNKSK